MTDFTPTTEHVRMIYSDYTRSPAEFDRWLAGVKAEAIRDSRASSDAVPRGAD